MRKGKGYGFLAKGWLWVGLLLGVSACSFPFNYEINVLNYASLSGTFTVRQGGSALTPRRWAPWRSSTLPTPG